MIHKYFAYKEGDYWRINDLLSMDQCRIMLAQLNWKKEVFASIQNYDEHGNVTSAPLWFDLDGPAEAVLAEARAFVQACEFIVNVTPEIFFSGGKGYHLLIQRKIEHPRVHELVADFAREVGAHLSTIDPKVYRTRAMFRINGSPASRKGRYKIELTREELFGLSADSIGELSTKQRFIESPHDPSKIDEDTFNAWLTTALDKLPTYNTVAQLPGESHSVALEMTPCLRTMLTTPAPPGERNNTVFTLARFFKTCGVDVKSCLDVMLTYPHWKAFESEGREVSKVLRSVYYSKTPSKIGCKTPSLSADLMLAYCDDLCHFHADFPWKRK
jgi:hypothetical protein